MTFQLRCRHFITLLFFMVVATGVSAESVFLNSGEIVEGKVIRETDSLLVVKTKTENKEIKRKDVKRTLYDESYKTIQYIYIDDETFVAGYIVAEDASSYTVRKKLNSPDEMVINKKKVIGVMTKQITRKDPTPTPDQKPTPKPKEVTPQSNDIGITSLLYFPSAGTLFYSVSMQMFDWTREPQNVSLTNKGYSSSFSVGYALFDSFNLFCEDEYTFKSTTTQPGYSFTRSGINNPFFGIGVQAFNPNNDTYALRFKLSYSPSLIKINSTGDNMGREYTMIKGDILFGTRIGALDFAALAGITYNGKESFNSTTTTGRHIIYSGVKAQYDLGLLYTGIGTQISWTTEKKSEDSIKITTTGSRYALEFPICLGIKISDTLTLSAEYFLSNSPMQKIDIKSTNKSTGVTTPSISESSIKSQLITVMVKGYF